MKTTVKDDNVKSVRFSVDTDEKLSKLALKRGMSKQQFVVCMVDYFYKTKKDPKDINDELLKNAINRKTDNIIAFIRTQEQDLLVPSKKQIEQLALYLQDLVKFFNEHLLIKLNEQDKTGKENNEYLKEVYRMVKRTDELKQDKAILKTKCLKLLEHYIAQREQMGMMTSKADKDALAEHVREQVMNL